MCGIVAYLGSNECKEVLVGGLTCFEYRGYDSAGLSRATFGLLQAVSSSVIPRQTWCLKALVLWIVSYFTPRACAAQHARLTIPWSGTTQSSCCTCCTRLASLLRTALELHSTRARTLPQPRCHG